MTSPESRPSGYRLLSSQFFSLLPYQVLMLVINAANVIIDSLFASNVIGKTAMSAIGFYAPVPARAFLPPDGGAAQPALRRPLFCSVLPEVPVPVEG